MLRFALGETTVLVTDLSDVESEDVELAEITRNIVSLPIGPSDGFTWQVLAARLADFFGDGFEVLEITPIPSGVEGIVY